ncbi:histone-lysine N-methyltransferase, H3 lysine-79 specific isoform X2 [Nilaparvata lugens]|uniref:histone-lysine N-methyltransferase, H3 lysine-79 specific isoform X2 n=1 Tax=Nilaparvata lugens TaxID=108931 RepID=UPI00193D4B6F|nr:histone-lysine N-methyltransferase, H3 lysine-79 specific isoform X2 [Nilaparvata lugens]
MNTSTVTQTAPSTPLRTINRGSNFKRHGNGSGRSSVSMSGKRKSAVELLQETKSLYVKSNTVLDKKQQLSALTCSSERKSPRHHSHHCHYHSDKTRRAHQPKSPRLVMSSASLVLPNQPVKSTSDQLQAKLRRLLNADSKENLVDVEDAPLLTNLPSSIPTPTSPQSSIDRMSSVILPPPKNFSESRRSSLASSQSQTSLVRTTKAGTLVSRDRQVDKQSKRRRRSRSGGDSRRSVSGRFCAEQIPPSRTSKDQPENVQRRSWFHKSLPDLSLVALPCKSRECSSSSATSSISSSEENPSCNYALYSASTNSSRSEKKQRSIARHRVSSGNNNKSSNSNSAMSVCSGHSRRQSARSSWRSLSDEDSASGDKTRDDYDDEEEDNDENIEVRDDNDDDDIDGGGCGDEEDDNEDEEEEDDDLNAERDEGFDGDVDLVFGSPVKSSASYIGAASTTVRYSRIRCDTDWSSTAVDGDYKDDNELVGSESLRHWRPILRSKSDVGRRYARLSYASPVDTSPTNPADLETFFQQLGLDAAEYNSLIAGNQSNSQTSSPVFFSDASTVDSAELCAVARRAMNKSGEALNEPEKNERENATDLPSVVERNARIIKWLCNCRKAAALSSKSTNDSRIHQQRHPTMS